MNSHYKTLVFITILIFTSCTNKEKQIDSQKNSIEIIFERTITSNDNPDIDGIDTIRIISENDLVHQSNFYDPDFYITENKKNIKSHYYTDWYDTTKCFYPITDTTKYQAKASKETKNILGYNCIKKTFYSHRDTITAYFTKDLDVDFSYIPNLSIQGCILEISIKDSWSTETWTAVDIDTHSKSSINIPKDYIDDESPAYKEKVAKRYENFTYPPVQLSKGDIAPNFSSKSIHDKRIELNKLKGKVVVLNFWYIACTGCVAEMPDLNSIANKFKNKEVEFISIASNSKNDLHKFLRRKKFDFQIIPYGDILCNLYSVTGYPTTIIIDKTGKIAAPYYFQVVEPHIGYNNLVKTIEDELKK